VPLSRALAIISGLASAIDAAHRKGVIHRDLKPENVFLVSDTHAKILDYGIAKAVAATTTFATAGIVGTLAYMAPEQAAGGEAAPAWDIWALSIILFELLTARHPFHGGLPVGRAIPVKTLAPALSDALAATIDRALSLSPEQRPASAQALLRAL
jgi:eukaryotic-like serine/threonine-protein kinase